MTERKAFELSGNFRTFLLDFQYRTLPRTCHSIFLTRFILILRDANEISLQLPLLAESWRSSSSVVRWLGIWTRPIVLGSWVASELKIIRRSLWWGWINWPSWKSLGYRKADLLKPWFQCFRAQTWGLPAAEMHFRTVPRLNEESQKIWNRSADRNWHISFRLLT